MRARHWVLTVNNYVSEDKSMFEDIKELSTYWIYGKEIGENGTPHLQCYLAFKKTIYLNKLKKYWPRGHFEVMQSKDPKRAADYCKKGAQSHSEWDKLGVSGPNFGLNADFKEYGELPATQGAAGGDKTKKLWDDVRKNAIDGNFNEIPPNILITHYGNIKKFYYDHQPRPADLPEPCGEWIWGKPGVGKSHMARIENPSYYDKMLNKWWDQYDGEECILLDDFEIDHKIFGHHLKRWSDKYSFTAEVKNHIQNIRPLKIVVTSNYHPKQIWDGDMLEAILRRFKIREITELNRWDTNLKTGKKTKKRIFVSPVTPYVAKKFKAIGGKVVAVENYADPQLKISSLLEATNAQADAINSVETTESYSQNDVSDDEGFDGSNECNSD